MTSAAHKANRDKDAEMAKLQQNVEELRLQLEEAYGNLAVTKIEFDRQITQMQMEHDENTVFLMDQVQHDHMSEGTEDEAEKQEVARSSAE